MSNQPSPEELNRRAFLKQGSLAAVAAMAGYVELRPVSAAGAEALTPIPVGPPVNYGVIGLGVWGREILTTLAQLPNAPVVALCDTFPQARTRAAETAPKAEAFDDHRKLLAKKEVQAVVVATPTHRHVEIVRDALAAGKHVYCEAPLAHTIEDAKAIARAAQAAFKVVFQSGLQERAHPQRHFVRPFIRSGALGRNVLARVQWHKKTSWARAAASTAREQELNWRLHNATSAGLIGENCIHLLDAAAWFMGSRPSAVTGFHSLLLWDDGRDVPDTVQAMFDFPDGARLMCDATLCNSFEAQYEVYYGSDSAILMRDNRAWEFKEPDSPLLEWEVYARKETIGGEAGICLVANASKQNVQDKDAAATPPFPNSPLYYALQAFTDNVGSIGPDVEEFISAYGEEDAQALRDHVAGLKRQPAAGWKEGLEATVLALKANEAALGSQKVELKKEDFEL